MTSTIKRLQRCPTVIQDKILRYVEEMNYAEGVKRARRMFTEKGGVGDAIQFCMYNNICDIMASVWQSDETIQNNWNDNTEICKEWMARILSNDDDIIPYTIRSVYVCPMKKMKPPPLNGEEIAWLHQVESCLMSTNDRFVLKQYESYRKTVQIAVYEAWHRDTYMRDVVGFKLPPLM